MMEGRQTFPGFVVPELHDHRIYNRIFYQTSPLTEDILYQPDVDITLDSFDRDAHQSLNTFGYESGRRDSLPAYPPPSYNELTWRQS